MAHFMKLPIKGDENEILSKWCVHATVTNCSKFIQHGGRSSRGLKDTSMELKICQIWIIN